MPRKQCNAVLDLWKRKHPMGSAMYAAIYSAAHVNQTFLNDMWIWRYPSLPWQPVVNRDGTPRTGTGAGTGTGLGVRPPN